MKRVLEMAANRSTFPRNAEITRRVLSGETYRSVAEDHGVLQERIRQIVLTMVREMCIYKGISHEWSNLAAMRSDAGLIDLLNEYIGQVYSVRRHTAP